MVAESVQQGPFNSPVTKERKILAFTGVLMIRGYRTEYLVESVPGASSSARRDVTDLVILGTEIRTTEFPGRIGYEMNGKYVDYTVVERVTETLFDPAEARGNPSFRDGKCERETIHHLVSVRPGSTSPSYKVLFRSVNSM